MSAQAALCAGCALITSTRRPARSMSPAVATVEVEVKRHIPAQVKGRPYRVEVRDKETVFQLVFFHARPDYLQRLLPTGQRDPLYTGNEPASQQIRSGSFPIEGGRSCPVGVRKQHFRCHFDRFRRSNRASHARRWIPIRLAPGLSVPHVIPMLILLHL